MLILRARNSKNFLEDDTRPEISVVRVYRSEYKNRITFDFKIKIKLKTVDTISHGVKKIKMTINKDAIMRDKTDFERLRFMMSSVINKLIGSDAEGDYSGKAHVSKLVRRNLAVLDEIMTDNFSYTNDSKNSIETLNTKRDKEKVITEMLLSNASQAIGQPDRTKNYGTTMRFEPGADKISKDTSVDPYDEEGLTAQDNIQVLIDEFGIDDMISNYLMIKRSGTRIDNVFKSERRLTGETVEENKRRKIALSKQNSIDGAMLIRYSEFHNRYNNNVDIIQLKEFVDTNPQKTAFTYNNLARSAVLNGVAPTNIVSAAVDKIITAKMLFEGT